MDEPITPAEIKLIRDQLDELRLDSAEKHKPWYREPSTFLSFVALLASLITFLISQRAQDAENIRARKEQLDTLLTNLIGLQSENSSLASVTDPLRREQASSLISTKHLIYLEEAEILVDKLGNDVSDAECNVLAGEMALMSNYKKAEVYYQKGLNVAQDDLSKATAYRFLGGFYFESSPLRDFDKGRRYFQESVDAMKGSPGDDYSKYTVGYTYEAWGWSEKTNGFGSEGDKMLERAKKYYSDMSAQNPLTQWALESFSSRTNGQAPAGPDGLARPPGK
jgi:hypothetical protein